MTEPTLTLRQAAARLGLHPTTLRGQVERGKLVATRLDTPRGAVWLVTPAAVEDYRQQRLGQPGRKKSTEG